MGEEYYSDDAEVFTAEAGTASALPQGVRRSRVSPTWIVDSGASYHFTPYETDFTGPITAPTTTEVRVGNRTVLPIVGQGTVKVRLPDDRELVLNGVQLVPEMHARLMSVG